MIHINPLFFICIAIISILNLLPQFLMVFGIAVLHEAAHALCSYIIGNRNIKFNIHPWGVCMTCDEFENPKSEFFAAAAGPFLNLILLLIGAILNLRNFYVANLFMLVINLLPVYPLDGGRILFAVLKNEFSGSVLRSIMKTVSAIITAVVFISGCFILYKTGVNFSVLTAAVFLSFTSDKVDYKFPDEPIKKTVHYTVTSDRPAKNILKYRKKDISVVFDVTDISGHYLGSVTYKEVLEQIADCGYEIKFAEILEKQLLY